MLQQLYSFLAIETDSFENNLEKDINNNLKNIKLHFFNQFMVND